MNQYLTPLKQPFNKVQGGCNAQTAARQGDWVCLNCQNLNFSFRKKCNRCKVQTREENERMANYYYQSYPYNYYYVSDKENFPPLCQTTPSHTNFESPAKTLPSPQTAEKNKLTKDSNRNKTQLPSVSPLVKRYARSGADSTEESIKGGLFEDESMWARIDLDYFEQNKQFLALDNEAEEQMAKIIEKLVI